MKSFSSLIFLLLFMAALAVPAYVFYNKWSANRRSEVATQPGQTVSTAAIFPSPQEKNPVPPAPAAGAPKALRAPAAPPAGGGLPVPPAAREAMEAALKSGKAPDGRPMPAEVRAVMTAALKGEPPPGILQPAVIPAPERTKPAPTSAAASYFAPASKRDPTVTPREYGKIREEEERARAAEKQQRLEMLKRQRETSGENRIKLQGIVGSNVIINGEMYSVGNTVQGVRILKIGSNYIIGEHKGIRFKKVMR